jgi:hypothetical protein
MAGACAMLVVASALGMFQIITRFVLEQPAEWSEILIRLSLIWMVFLGIPTAFRQGAMVSVDVLYRWSPPRVARARLDGGIASLALILVILWWGWDYAHARPRAIDGRPGIHLDVLGLPGAAGRRPVLRPGHRRQPARPERKNWRPRNDVRHAWHRWCCASRSASRSPCPSACRPILGIQATNANMLISVKEMFNSINKFPLAAIPFFILAGNLMETGGISRRLVEFAKSIVGGVQGGLPMTCVLTCMIFAAVSGSSVATTFAIGAILIPALIKHGYPTSYAAALQATSAELGVIIPPSIPMILYGVSAEVSIGELFIAGFGPGLLIGGALMLFCWAGASTRAGARTTATAACPSAARSCRPAGRC